MNNAAHKTAIRRKAPSVPMRWLHCNNKLQGRALDYGCGRGYDADHYKLDKYDPHYYCMEPTGEYDTVVCNYVLNVVHKDEQIDIMHKIKNLLTQDGKAYLTVRRDIKEDGYTSKGTYQETVRLNLPVVRETSTYCIYEMRRSYCIYEMRRMND
jgi:hypothetical protein